MGGQDSYSDQTQGHLSPWLSNSYYVISSGRLWHREFWVWLCLTEPSAGTTLAWKRRAPCSSRKSDGDLKSTKHQKLIRISFKLATCMSVYHGLFSINLCY